MVREALPLPLTSCGLRGSPLPRSQHALTLLMKLNITCSPACTAARLHSWHQCLACCMRCSLAALENMLEIQLLYGAVIVGLERGAHLGAAGPPPSLLPPPLPAPPLLPPPRIPPPPRLPGTPLRSPAALARAPMMPSGSAHGPFASPSFPGANTQVSESPPLRLFWVQSNLHKCIIRQPASVQRAGPQSTAAGQACRAGL